MTLGRKEKKSHSPPCASLDTLTGRVHPGNIFFFGILLEQIATKNIRAHIGTFLALGLLGRKTFLVLLQKSDMAQHQIFVQYQYQYFQKFCFQNQYQNLTSNFFNIKINTNIKISSTSISKSISKFFKTQNQYQNQYQYRQNIDIDIENQNFLGLKNLF